MRSLAAVAVLVLFCGLVTSRRGREGKPKIATRVVLADQLRDFPGVCFAATQCGTVEPGKTWDLAPYYCGQSTCDHSDDGRLVEVIEECITPPKNCRVDESRTNRTAPFPDCCPVLQCEQAPKESNYDEPEENYEEPQEQTRSRSSRRKGSRGSNRFT